MAARCVLTSLVFLLMGPRTGVTSGPVVHAPWGALRGIRVQGEGGREMVGYLGVPYAVPPVGERRFRKPLPHPGPGEGVVFAADRQGPACPQDQPALIGSRQSISEDCLLLNVYVPLQGDNSLPGPRAVMVFIHGGAFTMGDAASYRPSRMVADHQVIVVTLQYRLGALGFLSTGDSALPGNLGLWDQNLALRWVSDNIRAFGGDPDVITVFGESAGSYSAGLQMMSPQSRGLFRRVLMQSGSPETLRGFLTLSQPSDTFVLVAKQFRCAEGTSAQRVECLRKVPLEDYLNKTVQLIRQAPAGGLFYPVVDGEFLPGDPVALIQDEDYVKQNGIGEVDVLMGFTDTEGSLVLFLLAALQLPPQAVTSPLFFNTLVDTCIQFSQGKTLSTSTDVARKVVEFFYRGADSGTDRPVGVDTVTALYRDCIISTPTLQWMKYLASIPHSATRFLYTLDHPFAFNSRGAIPGAHHADDLLLQFDSRPLLPPDSLLPAMLHKTANSDDEEPLADMFVRIGTVFAETGDPSPAVPGTQAEGGWPQFRTADPAYLSLSLTPHVQHTAGPHADRWTLWHSLLPQLTALTSPAAADSDGQGSRRGALYGEKEEL